MPAIPAIRGLAQRHRRVLAALVAALAVVAAIGAIRSTPTPDVSTTPYTASGLRPGEVAVPVILANAALASAVDIGDLVDIVAAPSTADGSADVLASRARVLDQTGASGFTGTSTAMVLVAVPEHAALRLAAGLGEALTVVIRSR